MTTIVYNSNKTNTNDNNDERGDNVEIAHLQLSTSTGSRSYTSTGVPNSVDVLRMLNELNNSPSNKTDNCGTNVTNISDMNSIDVTSETNITANSKDENIGIDSPDMKQTKNRHGNKTINPNINKNAHVILITSKHESKNFEIICDYMTICPLFFISLIATIIIYVIIQENGQSSRLECDEWNDNNGTNVQYPWIIDSCDIFNGNNNGSDDDDDDDDINDDTWRLCNMFINVNKVHSFNNWFYVNISENITVCDWEYITCDDYNFNSLQLNNTRSRIAHINIDNARFCSDINISYIPSNLQSLSLKDSLTRFEWNASLFPQSIKILQFRNNYIYGNLNDLSNLVNLTQLKVKHTQLTNIDFTQISNSDFKVFTGPLSLKCDVLNYCGNKGFTITQRILSTCKSQDTCLETCGYCVPISKTNDIDNDNNSKWEPSMKDLTTMFIAVIGCLVSTLLSLFAGISSWKYNASGSSCRTLISSIGAGTILTCFGSLMILTSAIATIIYGNPYVVGISAFVGAVVSTLGWGSMDYGFFTFEKKCKCLKTVMIEKKYYKLILKHEIYGKLYYYDKCKDVELKIGDDENSFIRRKKYLILYKVGSLGCFGNKKNCFNLCYFRGPTYMEFRSFTGSIFAFGFASCGIVWFYLRFYDRCQHKDDFYDFDFLENLGIDCGNNASYIVTCLLVILFIIPSIFSKFALIQSCVFVLSFIIINVLNDNTSMFEWPYYDYTAIAIIGPASVFPIDIWVWLIWAMLSLIISFEFSSKSEINKLASIVLSNFASVFDLMTDYIVIYVWVTTNNIRFAAAQCCILLMSSLYATISVHNEIKKKKKSQNMNSYKMSQIFEISFTLLGCGSLWKAISVWHNFFQNNKHYRKSKISENLLESFPSVGLGLYVTLSQDLVYSPSVFASIIFSFINISITIARITTKHSKLQNENIQLFRQFSQWSRAVSIDTSDDNWYINTKTGEVIFRYEQDYNPLSMARCYRLRQCPKSLINGSHIDQFYTLSFVWCFTITDLFLRIIPPIILHLIIKNEISSILADIISILLLFCLIMVNYIIYKNHAKIGIFSGIFTSSYYFWSVIGVKFFQTKVSMKSFIKEQSVRLIISCVILIIAIIISAYEYTWKFRVFMIAFPIVLTVHSIQLYFVKLDKVKV